jgi:hypothetical protein
MTANVILYGVLIAFANKMEDEDVKRRIKMAVRDMIIRCCIRRGWEERGGLSLGRFDMRLDELDADDGR